MDSLFELHNITKKYNARKVLEIPHLIIKKGGIYGVMGPNGAGKTTLLSIKAFLLPPTSGTLHWEGTDVASLNRHMLRRKVTLINQNPYLFHTTVWKNVAYGLKIRGIDRRKRREKVRECLDLVGLPNFDKRMTSELSGGEIQRVAIARALALDPQVLLLDEPTANVDHYGVQTLERILRGLNETLGITIILASHEADHVYRVSDEVIYLFEGRIVKSPMENLFKGKLLKGKKDLFLFDTGMIQVAILPERDEVSYISIPPEDIIISRKPLVTSARNSFAGTISHMSDEGDAIGLVVDVGELLKVKITKRSLREMKLNVGSHVHLTFKSSSVEVF